MQATTGFHDSVPYPILEEAEFVLHDPVTFHPTNGVFNAHADDEMRRLVACSGGAVPLQGVFSWVGRWCSLVGSIPGTPYLDTGSCPVVR
jgi:hypothetical protein